MQREIQLTADGSHTIAIPGLKVSYHSHHGAVGESRHVYIEAGLIPVMRSAKHQPVRILEIGFGTGLNILLSLEQAIKKQQAIHYTAIEIFPLSQEELTLLNHGKLLSMQDAFMNIHNAPWEQDIPINTFFTLRKLNISLLQFSQAGNFDCIFFDAFAPSVQPELWTKSIFENMYRCLSPGGILVTYSSKSDVRRAMEAVGFTVTKTQGPWGKREMVRAEKIGDQ
jgi:tRNA U34 5-methylaminomethyl-2-thiouridine-forming methyltransferase MnmC